MNLYENKTNVKISRFTVGRGKDDEAYDKNTKLSEIGQAVY